MARRAMIMLVLPLAAGLAFSGCGSGRPAAASGPGSVSAAVQMLRSAMATTGLTTCSQKPAPNPPGAVQATTLTLGACGRPDAGVVEIVGYPSDAARATGLKELSQPALPWTQGWAWGRIAVVINQNTPTDETLATGKALDSLHASLAFEQ